MRDEAYVLKLCDEVLGRPSVRQHRFPFLRGDSGRTLPVDAFYPDLSLVVEYRERQHSESVPFFDRRKTISGVSRAEQRRRYDQRRRDVLPQNGLRLLELSHADFQCNSRRRLKRNRERDVEVLRNKLRTYAAV